MSGSHPFTKQYSQISQNLQGRLVSLDKRQKNLDVTLKKSMNYRLVVGAIALIVGLVVAASPELKELGLLFLVSLGGFIYLVRRHKKIKHFKDQITLLQGFYRRHLTRVQRGMDPDSDIGMSDIQNPTAKDLHLFGHNSFFQLLDESFSQGGKAQLMDWIQKPLMDASLIFKRHQHIQDICLYPGPLRKLRILGAQIGERLRTEDLKQFMQRPVVLDKFQIWWKAHLIFFPLAWALVILSALQLVPLNPALPLLAYILFALSSLSQIAPALRRAEDLSISLNSLNPIFKHIEHHPQIFKSITPQVISLKPSQSLKQLQFCISGLSIEAHWLIHLIVNALMPWSYFFAYKTEQWRNRYHHSLTDGLNELHHVEALMSYGFLYIYQSQVFPKFSDDKANFQEVFHPLIARENVVANSFHFSERQRLVLLTGSNMSGKSTFLRTVGLNQHLALIGCPVFAKSFHTQVCPVVTCLQISDSLADGYSSFYYEVRRVKEILERIKSGEHLLFLIDEIFRGTNNRERLLGSRAIIEHLAKEEKSFGFISTHDLELTHLADNFKELAIYHFRDEVKDGHLHFSYHIHSGPCPTTNALKIMAQEGLPV